MSVNFCVATIALLESAGASVYVEPSGREYLAGIGDRDDGYEPTRTPEAMKQLYEKDQVFGFIGNVGTPTAAVAVPYALERRTLFFGAFTGANNPHRAAPSSESAL